MHLCVRRANFTTKHRFEIANLHSFKLIKFPRQANPNPNPNPKQGFCSQTRLGGETCSCDVNMHNALISGHPGGLTLGTYGGIARDLLTFVANFWPGTGALDHFCTSKSRYTGKDPRDL